MMKTALVLLVRNERPCLEKLLSDIPRPGETQAYDLMVAVDGGSTDGTVDYLEANGIQVVSQSRRGRGEAFQMAFTNIEADAYIFFSPDGNEAIEDLGRFRPLLEGDDPADIVIASRMMKESRNEEDDKLFRWRKWANNAFNLAANVAFRKQGPFITDSINGYRAITLKAARELELDASDYTIEYQMTMRALKRRLRIVEFPTIEGHRIAGDSGAPSIPTGLRFIRCFWKELIR